MQGNRFRHRGATGGTAARSAESGPHASPCLPIQPAQRSGTPGAGGFRGTAVTRRCPLKPPESGGCRNSAPGRSPRTYRRARRVSGSLLWSRPRRPPHQRLQDLERLGGSLTTLPCRRSSPDPGSSSKAPKRRIEALLIENSARTQRARMVPEAGLPHYIATFRRSPSRGKQRMEGRDEFAHW
jgi:hypothetical protein